MKNIWLHLLGGAGLGLVYLLIPFFPTLSFVLGVCLGWEINQFYVRYNNNPHYATIKNILYNALLDIVVGVSGSFITMFIVNYIQDITC